MRSALVWLCAMAVGCGGCSALDALSVRSQSPEEPEPAARRTRLVRDLAVPFGLHPIPIEWIGLVTGLRGTGSDPAPSPQRAVLLDEMQTRGVEAPNRVMASSDTALVTVRGILRPGIQKGDRFDIEVRVPSRSETTSLRGGQLLETRLRPLAVLSDQMIHEGKVLALAEGPVMIDPMADARGDRVLQTRGRVLGGGVALESRQLGLVLKPDQQSVVNSAKIETAVNRRFHTFDRGLKVGMAKAKTDEYVELKVHPRYKDNVYRYVQVVRALALHETDGQLAARIEELHRKLLDPAEAPDAAVQLEAIGAPAVETLISATKSPDPAVRFFAAEALAYLDRSEAAEPLGEIARTQPAFRVFALGALSAMNDYAASSQLREMLDLASAETRYGAFRALWTMNNKDPLVAGERLGPDQFGYHVIETNGPDMIHVTASHRPEVVLFGSQMRLATPLAVNAGNLIMVTATGPGEIAVSRYAVGEPDQRRVVSDRLDEVIRTIAELGGSYPDVVQALEEAKAAGALPCRLEVDALPQLGRIYDLKAADETDGEELAPQPAKSGWSWSSLWPFGKRPDATREGGAGADPEEAAAKAGKSDG